MRSAAVVGTGKHGEPGQRLEVKLWQVDAWWEGERKEEDDAQVFDLLILVREWPWHGEGEMIHG